MASSDSQIDKPQCGRPKRTELPGVNIITGAQSINTESASLKNDVTIKWYFSIFQEMMQPKYSSGFYIEQLQNHRERGLNKNSPRKLSKGLEPVEVVLRSLEVDLRTHPNTT